MCDWEVVGHLLVDPWEGRETPCGRTAESASQISGWKTASQGWPSPLPHSSSRGKMPLPLFLCRRRFQFFCPEWTVSRLRWPFLGTGLTFVPSDLCILSPLPKFFLPLRCPLRLLRCLCRMSTLWNLPQPFPDVGENPSAIFPAAPLVHFPGLGWNFLRSNHLGLFFRGSDRVYPVSSGSHLMPWRMWSYMLAGLLADWLNKWISIVFCLA